MWTCLKNFLIVFILLCQFGCSFFNKKTEQGNLSNNNNVKVLEVPPDLITPSRDLKYSLPTGTSNTLSEYDSQRGQSKKENNQKILPEFFGMNFKFYGDQKVLVIEKSPEYLWPKLKDFWTNSGFSIVKELPERGIIETDWFEDRTKLPQDFIRNTIGKIFDNIYDTGERDKFHMRIERTLDGYSEVSIVHRGLIEVASENRNDGTVIWTNKKENRQLEEDYLRKIMSYLGASDELVKKSENITKLKSSSLKNEENDVFIELNEGFENAWRSVGLAIDRVGFELDDQIRSDGNYFIRYRDIEIKKNKKGFFSNLFSFGKKENKPSVYIISIISEKDISKVFVKQQNTKNSDGSARNILTILLGQLN